MIKRRLIGLCTAMTLSGCYPTLSSGVGIKFTGDPTVQSVLDAATDLQEIYGKNYEKGAIFADFSQLPLVGAAAAAAWILLNNNTGAATVAGHIGIGAGAYSAARGQLIATNMPEIYIAGHGALTCVLAEGPLFSGGSAKQRREALDGKLQDIANKIAALQILNRTIAAPVVQAVAGAGAPAAVVAAAEAAATAEAEDASVLTAVRALAEQVVTQARIVEQASLLQEAAFDDATPYFRTAVAAISVRVASRGRVRPALDFATLRDSFSANPKVAAGDKVAAAAMAMGFVDAEPVRPTARDLVHQITEATSALVTATAILSASTPHYVESLARVAACPNQIT